MLDRFNNLQQRIIASFVVSLCFLGSIYYSHTPGLNCAFLGLMAIAIGGALWEYYHMVNAKGYRALTKIGLFSSASYLFAIYLRTQIPEAQILPEIVLGLALLASFLYYFYDRDRPLINLAVTFFGLAYLTLPLSYLVEINYLHLPPTIQDGRWCLVYVLLLTKTTDMGAYFIGKWIGRTPLCPSISPKKTWEGAIGGFLNTVIVGILASLSFRFFFDTPPLLLSPVQTILLPIGISIMGQLGDLAESLLKRDTGIKDSSSYFPGLGGALDLLDSLVFAAPFCAIVLKLSSIE